MGGQGSGPALGNVNAVKHGQRSKRHGLVHAKLGKRFATAYWHGDALRKAIETLLIKRHGSVLLAAQARIQTIIRLEESCRALEKSMADVDGKLTAEEVRLNRESICRWAMQRDNALQALLGDAQANGNGDPWACLHDPPHDATPAHHDNASGENGHQHDNQAMPPENASDATPAIAGGNP